ncbi:MAG: hypothetical protein MAG451_01942 [Anaerolineales bacterium]|nr:hypothetical protein [Anaerolineales bacterium]
MGHWSLRRKIVTFVVVIMLVFLVARGIVKASQSYHVYLKFLTENARGTAEAIVVAIEHGDYWGHSQSMQKLLLALQAQIDQPAGGEGVENARGILVANHTGQVVAATDSAMMGTLLPEDARRSLAGVISEGAIESFSLSAAAGATDWLAVPVAVDGRRVGALAIEYFRRPAQMLADATVKYEFFAITVLTMGLVLILLVGIRKMVLQPLALLQTGVERLGEGDLDARIELRTGDELEVVARALNRMAARLKSYHAQHVAREKQTALVNVAGTTADELSQPLTVVLGYAELLQEEEVPNPELLEEAARSIQRSSRKMAGIVRQLSNMGDASVIRATADRDASGCVAGDRSNVR